MKKLILFALLMCTVTVHAQLITKRFNTSHVQLSDQTSLEEVQWVVNNNNTATNSTDDVLQVFTYNNYGEVTALQIFKILSITHQGATGVFQVELV